MKLRIISSLCILIGLLIFLYPTVKDRYESYRQQAILKQWQMSLSQIDLAVPDQESPDSIAEQPGSSPEPSASVEPTRAPSPSPASQNHVEGVLIIDKINLKLPILTGATAGNLNLSVASIEHTGRVGEVGNYAIAGHRNFTYGKNFNRLDEVEVGDWIGVDTGSKEFWYQVQEKLYVSPQSMWVLQGNGKDKEITLITCHPMENPTQRIVIRGQLEDRNSSLGL